jgi:Ca2+-binding RTX toxin-like protein
LIGIEAVEVHGSSRADTLVGGAGNDALFGRYGNDSLVGGDGDDILDGAGDNDILMGGNGNDTLHGGWGTDRLDGGLGLDTAKLDFGHVSAGMNFTLGSDVTVSTPYGSTRLIGIEAVEFIGTYHNDTITGGALSDRLLGGEGTDLLTGKEGADILDGGKGLDTLHGGLGDDVYVLDAYRDFYGYGYETIEDVVVELSGEGTDEVRTSLGWYTLGAHLENLTGTNFQQHLIGNSQANTVRGSYGSDTLDGGVGADTLVGADGDDVYIVDSLSDVVTELAGEGKADEVRTSLSNYVLPVNVEKLTYTGTGPATLTGNSGGNALSGAGGNDVFMLQQGGDDTASGGGGNDGFFLGAALSAGDELDGGAGVLDQLGLQGNYAGLTLGAKNLVGIEQIVLLPGSDSRFGDTSGALYSYNLITVDANVAAGQRLIVTANTLRAGETFRVRRIGRDGRLLPHLWRPGCRHHQGQPDG